MTSKLRRGPWGEPKSSRPLGGSWSDGFEEELRPTAPEPVARYQRLTVLGQGGMGRVWLGWDNTLKRNVAIKTPHGGADSPQAAALRQEAMLAAHLDHPNIITVHDVVDSPDGPEFVMALVRGRTFAELLADAGTDMNSRAALLRPLWQACRAVGHAHERGIVHRDLSPHNILLADDGGVRIVDWGLAYDPASGSEPRRAGTRGYTSPEQERGNPPHPTTDVWTLGTILGELLWGDVDRSGAAPLPSHAQGTSEELAAIAMRATAREPATRYANATALADDIQRWLEGRTVQAYQSPPWRLAARLLYRWRWPLLGGFLAILSVLVAVLWGASRAADEASQARRAEGQAQTAKQQAERALAEQLAERAVAAEAKGDVQAALRLAEQALSVADAAPRARGVLALLGALPFPPVLDSRRLPACKTWVPSGRSDRLICHDPKRVWAYDGVGEAWVYPFATYTLRVGENAILVPGGNESLVAIDLESGSHSTFDGEGGIFADPLGAWRYARDGGGPLTEGLPASPCHHTPLATQSLGDGRFAFACGSLGVIMRAPGEPDVQVAGPGVRALEVDDRGRLWGGTTGGTISPLDTSGLGDALSIHEPVRGLWTVPGRNQLVAQSISGAVFILATAPELRRLYALPPADFPVGIRPDGSIELVDRTSREWKLLRPESAPPRAEFVSHTGFATVEWVPGVDWVVAGDGGGDLFSFSPRSGGPVYHQPWLAGVVKSISAAPGPGGAILATGMYARGTWALDRQARRPPALYTPAPISARRAGAFANGAAVWAGFTPGLGFASGPRDGRELLHEHTFHDISLSANRQIAAVLGRGLWTIDQDGYTREVLEPDHPTLGAFNTPAAPGWVAAAIHDDGRLALARDHHLLLLDAHGTPIHHWFHPGATTDVVFVPRSEFLATTGVDGTVRLFHEDHARPWAEIPAHGARAAALAASSDGQWLISAGWDGRLRVASIAHARRELAP